MISGSKEGLNTNGALVTIQPPTNDREAYCFLRMESSAGFDGTITLMRRPKPGPGASAAFAAITPIAGFYRKEADGTMASVGIALGVSAKADFMIDMSSQELVPTMAGRTAGTVSLYWVIVDPSAK